jgi:hypothetical protein
MLNCADHGSHLWTAIEIAPNIRPMVDDNQLFDRKSNKMLKTRQRSLFRLHTIALEVAD